MSAIDRRRFLGLAAAAAATPVLGTDPLLGRGNRVAGVPSSRPENAASELAGRALQQALGNMEPPALQFQAWPGGTGALLERLWRESGRSPFERTPIGIEPWDGPVPTAEEEIAFLPVHRLAALIREGHITSVELTGIYLERMRRHDPALLIAVTILEERALAEAAESDAELRAGNWRGPLHGIPWGVKDLFSARGAPTTWGHGGFRDRVIDEDAEVIVRLRAAGAVLIAKLATGEFALGDRWYRGRTNNPWNPEQGSSGSSAGPASAMAAGCVAFAIGTETQGSIASPARRCGISALRPTFGRVSRDGGMVLSWSMDKIGPMCRSMEDCALVFEAIHGSSELDPASLTAPFVFDRNLELANLRIGYTDNAPEGFVEGLRELGADMQPMPELPSGGSNALAVESAAAFDAHVAPEVERAAEAGEDPPSGRFMGGRAVSGLDFVQSQRGRWELMREMERVMEGWDMFVSGSGEVGLTNQTGHPAAIVPWTMSEGDRSQPVCTTIIGRLFADDLILGVAHAWQKATDFHLRRPRLG
jgi:Asp-tRNA(Asn)/Glu-tRNA(Gln) amidotransferase A subunit family amidase